MPFRNGVKFVLLGMNFVKLFLLRFFLKLFKYFLSSGNYTFVGPSLTQNLLVISDSITISC